jgi:hypothetical protein
MAGAAAKARDHGWRERYRERCRDEDGSVHDVIVSKDAIGLTQYTLADGRRLRFVDDCRFEVAATGTLMSRCD